MYSVIEPILISRQSWTIIVIEGLETSVLTSTTFSHEPFFQSRSPHNPCVRDTQTEIAVLSLLYSSTCKTLNRMNRTKHQRKKRRKLRLTVTQSKCLHSDSCKERQLRCCLKIAAQSSRQFAAALSWQLSWTVWKTPPTERSLAIAGLLLSCGQNLEKNMKNTLVTDFRTPSTVNTSYLRMYHFYYHTPYKGHL